MRILLILSKTVLREVSFGEDILPREHNALLMDFFDPAAKEDAPVRNVHRRPARRDIVLRRVELRDERDDVGRQAWRQQTTSRRCRPR